PRGPRHGHRMEQEAPDADGQEIQDEEIVPEEPVLFRLPRKHHRARKGCEDEAAIGDGVEGFSPEGGVAAPLAIGKNRRTAACSHRTRCPAKISVSSSDLTSALAV